MHPENAIFALFLPGALFCILMFMERKKHVPNITILGRRLPLWIVYVIVFVGGPLFLVLLLIQSITRKY
jgi:TRAP-type C4-dicarboxylate transport system permease small subunit